MHTKTLLFALLILFGAISKAISAEPEPRLDNFDKKAREALYRPPYIETQPGGEEPLIVSMGFLSRPDSSTLAQRGRDPHNLLNRQGKPIADPSLEYADNAFEADPNINFEKWGEYWRKVHGVRFTYSEDPSDTSLLSLLRYDQLHRIPAGPTNLNPPPYFAPADAQGRLYSTIIGHVPDYRRPKWDGIAYLNFKDKAAIGTVFSSGKFKSKITPEDSVLFRMVAPYLSRQYIIIPSKSGRDSITLVKTHVRRSELNRDEFQSEWLNHHAKVVLSQPATEKLVKRYVQLHNIGPPDEGKPFYHKETCKYDVVTLMSFENVNDLEDFIRSPSFAEIEADEKKYENVNDSEYWTALNYNVVNRIFPERKTKILKNKSKEN